MFSLKDITNLPDNEILRIRKGKRRGSYKRHPRPCFSREHLIEYLQDNGFRTVRQIRRERGEGEPTSDDYVKEFGSWSRARDIVFGAPEPEPDFDVEYMLKGIIEFDLWTWRKYIKTQKKRPDIFPSIYRVRKRWGSFSNMIYLARKMSITQTLNAYVRLWRKCGHTPTLKECDSAGVDVSAVIKFFEGKRAMDDYVSRMEELHENKR